MTIMPLCPARLFFDNERWNITECSRLGIKCVYTPRGLTSAAWQEGLAMFTGTAARAYRHKSSRHAGSVASPEPDARLVSYGGLHQRRALHERRLREVLALSCWTAESAAAAAARQSASAPGWRCRRALCLWMGPCRLSGRGAAAAAVRTHASAAPVQLELVFQQRRLLLAA